MNLKKYKAEILRRSEVKIKKRKQARRIALICIPLVLVAAALLAIPEQDQERPRQELAQDSDGMTMGSIYCSFVQAELYADGQKTTVTDKRKVDKIFTIAHFVEDAAEEDRLIYGSPPTLNESECISDNPAANTDPACPTDHPQHWVTLKTAEGDTQTYYLTQNQYELIMEVLQ